jgi:Lecithin retinol acyltransferase
VFCFIERDRLGAKHSRGRTFRWRPPGRDAAANPMDRGLWVVTRRDPRRFCNGLPSTGLTLAGRLIQCCSHPTYMTTSYVNLKSREPSEPMICERLLASAQEPPLGAHIVTPRRGYTHHGIYVGRGKVVQYAGLTRGLHRGPVEEVVLTQFTQGHPIWVRPEESRRFDSDEVVRRARSRVGEDRYHVFTNNCEHFCEWCIRG